MLEHVLQIARAGRTTTSAPTAAASSSPSRCRQSAGRNGRIAGVSITPVPSALATATLPARDRFHQPGDAEQRVAAQLERIAEVVVEPAEDDVDRLQAVERLEEHAAVAHGQVAALDEREAEIAREVGVLEVGLVVRAGRQQDDLRGLSRFGRERAQRVALGAEERREPLDLAVAKRLGQAARQDDAVLERIAGAGRRLRAVGEHPPVAVGATREIDGVQVEVDVVRHADAVARPQERRVRRARAPAAADRRAAALRAVADRAGSG